jgi:signal transduction histidine kinase
MFRLQIYDNRGTLSSSLSLGQEAVTIGRDPSCELPLSDINISRKHARIEPMGRFYIVRDLKSTNGTWVNQNPVQMHLLKDGDVVRIGNFRLLLQSTDVAAGEGGDGPGEEESHTKIIEEPFSYDASPESHHTLRIEVGKAGVPLPSAAAARERLLRLHDISRKLGFIEAPSVLCGQAVEVVLEELKADRASILVPDGDDFRTLASKVTDSEKGRSFDIHHGVLRSAIEGLAAILTEDADRDTRFRADGGRAGSGVRSVMCVPLVARTILQGAIYVDRTTSPEPFAEDDLRFLAVIGSQVAINLANARLFEDVLLEKQKVQAVLSSLRDGLVIVDQDLAIGSCNAAAARILFPDTAESPLGKSIIDLLLARDLSLEENDLQAALRERKGFRLLIHRGSDTRAYDAAVAAIEPGEGTPAGYILSFRDTTDLLHIQELKSEFIRNASHKLRTPLTVVMGSLDLLRSLPPDEDLGENREVLIDGMEKNLSQLQALVTRFLEFAELDRTRFKLRELDLREVVGIASSGLAAVAAEKKIRLKNSIPRDRSLRVLGDMDRLVQCVHNIIENAVKFAPEKSTVEVRCEAGEGSISLRIEDDGPGIPSDHLSDIFSGFHQVEKIPTGEMPGAGLGLTIAKQIIHAHRGSIAATSPVPATGKGTAITISLPKPGGDYRTEPACEPSVRVLETH